VSYYKLSLRIKPTSIGFQVKVYSVSHRSAGLRLQVTNGMVVWYSTSFGALMIAIGTPRKQRCRKYAKAFQHFLAYRMHAHTRSTFG